MEQTTSVWLDRNIRDQLWRWSTLTGLVISVGRTQMFLSIWQNCCPQYRNFCWKESVLVFTSSGQLTFSLHLILFYFMIIILFNYMAISGHSCQWYLNLSAWLFPLQKCIERKQNTKIVWHSKCSCSSLWIFTPPSSTLPSLRESKWIAIAIVFFLCSFASFFLIIVPRGLFYV